MTGPPAEGRRRRRDLLLSLVVPALVCLVAVVHTVRVDSSDLSTWSGAGFGMFATIDGETTRTVRGFVDVDGVEEEVPLPSSLERAAFEVAVLPTSERAERLAERWADELDLTDARVSVEVRRIAFDGDDLTAGTERVLLVGSAP